MGLNSLIQQHNTAATVVALVALWWHYDRQEKRRRRRVLARNQRQVKRLHDRTYNALKTTHSRSARQFPDKNAAMTEDLLTYIRNQERSFSESLQECGISLNTHQDDFIDYVLDLAKKNINVFPLGAVKPCWFQLYADACIAKAAWFLEDFNPAYKLHDVRNGALLSQTVSILDNALIIAGGGNEQTKETIHEILRRLDRILYPPKNNESEEYADDEEEHPSLATKKTRWNKATTKRSNSFSLPLPIDLAFVPKICHPVPRIDNPSLAKFESIIHKSNTPVILTDTLSHWPAFCKWHDARYWLRRTLNGLRLVPIEIGQSYTDEGWRQEIMTFDSFLEDFILQGEDAEEIAYLAQHDLFSQVPELRADIEVPDYCFADVPQKMGGENDLKSKSDVPVPFERTGEPSINVPRTLNGSNTLKRKADEMNSAKTSGDQPCTDYDSVKRTRTNREAPISNPIPSISDELESSGDGMSTIDEPSVASVDHGLKRKATESNPDEQTDELSHNHCETVKKARKGQTSTESSLDSHREHNRNDKSGNETTNIHQDHEIQSSAAILTSVNQPERTTPPSPSPPPPPTIHQNIWFGTRTVTPLHHDPYSNILTQIHGTKYIRLYSPAYTSKLYPRSSKEIAPHVPSNDSTQTESDTEAQAPPTIDMSNTSNVPLWSIEQSPHEDWDELYPGFSSVPYLECLLQEGEALYIPKGWWHYVRGVSAVGIGVSFWW